MKSINQKNAYYQKIRQTRRVDKFDIDNSSSTNDDCWFDVKNDETSKYWEIDRRRIKQKRRKNWRKI